MSAEDIFGLLVPATFIAMWAIEAKWPARRFPHTSGRRLIGIGFFLLMAVITTIVPLAIPPEWLERHRLLDFSGLGVLAGALIGYVVLSFVSYVWHRSAHRFAPMWRLFHQVHHSPQYVDMSGAMIFHPTEMVIYALLTILTTTLVLGLDPVAAALTGYIAAFYSLFQHWNIRTPRWLGYLIQRPEAHCVHHQREVHHYNFADLPLWDILAGTFRNPPSWQGEVGFEPAASRRLGAMLAFRDVNAADYGPASLGIKDKARVAAI